MSGTEAQNAWIGRVLGVRPDGSGGGLPGGGLIEYRKALLAYDAAKKAVTGQIEALAGAIGGELPAEAAFVAELRQTLVTLNERVGDAVIDALNSAGDARTGANAAAVSAMEGSIMELETSALVRHVDNNPLVPVSVRATLGGALRAIVATVD